jgi:glycosyltransferase involved in cell wall biosynthesis
LTLKDVSLLKESLLTARHQIPCLQLLAIGVSVPGSILPFQTVLQLEGEWILETGRVPFHQMGLYLSACDVLILPLWDNISNRARWPSRINDYLAVGRPIVSTKVGEIKPMFERYDVGIATEPTSESIAQGIMSVYNNPDVAEHYSRQARLLAEGDLNWAKLTEGVETFYLKLKDGGREPS